MKEVCAYLLWARVDKLIIKYDITDEIYNYCAAMGDSKLFGISIGVPDLWHVASYQFLIQLLEFSDLIQYP